MTELARRFEVHPAQVREWRRKLATEAAAVFAGSATAPAPEADEDPARLQTKIGRLTMENDFLRKALRRLR